MQRPRGKTVSVLFEARKDRAPSVTAPLQPSAATSASQAGNAVLFTSTANAKRKSREVAPSTPPLSAGTDKIIQAYLHKKSKLSAHPNRTHQIALLRALDLIEAIQDPRDTINKEIRRLGVYNALIDQIENHESYMTKPGKSKHKETAMWKAINAERTKLRDSLPTSPDPNIETKASGSALIFRLAEEVGRKRKRGTPLSPYETYLRNLCLLQEAEAKKKPGVPKHKL